MPDRDLVRLDIDAEHVLYQPEQTANDFMLGEIEFHFLFGEGVPFLTQFFRGIGHVPSVELIQSELGFCKILQLREVILCKRTRALCQILQKLDYLLGRGRHLGHQRHFGEIGITEQLCFFVA